MVRGVADTAPALTICGLARSADDEPAHAFVESGEMYVWSGGKKLAIMTVDGVLYRNDLSDFAGGFQSALAVRGATGLQKLGKWNGRQPLRSNPRHLMIEVNSTAPHDNPLFAALSALARPEVWASVTALPQTRPHRFRVELKLVHSDQVRLVELRLRSEREIADVWEEFNDWYLASYSQHTLVE